MGRKSKLSKVRSEAMKKWHSDRRKKGVKHTGGAPGRSRTKYSVLIPNGQKTDLSFLESFGKRETTWNYGRTKKLVEMLQAGKTPAACARYFTLGEPTVKTMIQELKRAYKEGMTLEEYFKKDRPCQYGKKVVAK
jgi:hypothetical protein